MILKWVGAAALALTLTAAAQTPAPSAEKQRMIDLGIEHQTARALYEHLKGEANGGQQGPGPAGVTRRTILRFFGDCVTPRWVCDIGIPTVALSRRMVMGHLSRPL